MQLRRPKYELKEMAYEEHKNLNESFQKSHLNRTHYNQLIGADEMSFDKGSNAIDWNKLDSAVWGRSEA